VVAALILLSSLYHFSDLGSKGEDYSFIGFPAIWNIIVFYVFALDPPGWLTYALLIVLVVLTFVPMSWVHPMRVKRLQALTLAMTVAWTVAAIAAVWSGFPAPLWTKVVLVVSGLYFVGLTLELSFRTRVG